MSDENLKKWAQWYIDAGMWVFPVAIKNEGGQWKKKPLVKWRTECSKSSENFGGLANGIGVSCDVSGLMLLDIDTKNGVDGLQSIAKVEEELGPRPATWTQKTVSGGRHEFYRMAPGVKNSVGKLGPGLDIRGIGGMAILGGSLGYSWEPGLSPAEIKHPAVLPSAWLERILSLSKETLPEVDKTSSSKGALSKKTLAFIAIGAPAGQRNQECFMAALDLHTSGYGEQEAIDLLTRRATPDFTAEEIKATIRSAYSREARFTPDFTQSPEMMFVGAFEKEFGGTVRADIGAERSVTWMECGEGNIWRPCNPVAVEGYIQKSAESFAEKVAEEFKRRPAEDENVSKWQKEFSKALLKASTSYRKINEAKLVAPRLKSLRFPRWEDSLDGYLDLANGRIRLDDLTFHERRPEDYVTTYSGVSYDADAKCPKFLEFLANAVEDEDAEYLQKASGYMLTASTMEDAIFFIHGLRNTGKSTFATMLGRILGDYSFSTDHHFLEQDAHTSFNSMLEGKRLVIVNEVKEERIDADRIKALSGDKEATVRRLYEEPRKIKLKAKYLLVGNHKPIVPSGDSGFWRRIKLIRFLGAPDQVIGLRESIWEETPGFLNWCLEGLLKYRKDALKDTAGIRAEVAEYQNDSNRVKPFIEERIQRLGVYGQNHYLAKNKVYEKFVEWCYPEKHVLGRVQFWKDFKQYFVQKFGEADWNERNKQKKLSDSRRFEAIFGFDFFSEDTKVPYLKEPYSE